MSAWRTSENFNVFDYPVQAGEPGQSEQPEASARAPLREQPEQSERS